jgi:hypothetical protein
MTFEYSLVKKIWTTGSILLADSDLCDVKLVKIGPVSPYALLRETSTEKRDPTAEQTATANVQSFTLLSEKGWVL